MANTMPFTPRPGDTQNEYGFWQALDGSLAPGQETPGMRDNPELTNYYDPAKGGLRYNLRNGQRVYQNDWNPVTGGYTGQMTDPGGGAFHGVPQWNQKTGRYDVHLDWGKIGSYAAGAGIAAPFVVGALAGAGGGAASGGAGAAGAGGGGATAGGGLASTTLPGSSVLGGSGLSSGGLVGGTSGAGMGGGGMGFLDSLKTGYDWYNKGKGVYDTVKGPSNGPSKASALGQTAGSIEAQRMNALIQQARLQQSQDQLAQNRSVLALRAPGQEASNSVRGDILANSRDAEFSGLPSYIHVPQMSGGLRPSMLSDSSRALGANMSRQALANNLSGKDVPDLTPLPEAGKLDSILQGIGGVSSFWDALNNHGGGSSPTPPSPPDTSGTGYGGVGTPGYPGDDPASPVNPPMPPITSQAPNPEAQQPGIDPEILKWLARTSQPGAPQ